VVRNEARLRLERSGVTAAAHGHRGGAAQHDTVSSVSPGRYASNKQQ
jgi:hypothetical protein